MKTQEIWSDSIDIIIPVYVVISLVVVVIIVQSSHTQCAKKEVVEENPFMAIL